MRARILTGLLGAGLGVGRGVRTLAAVDTHHVEMPDGVRLATDVHRPGPGTHPTILIRTPYGRDGLTGIPMVAQAKLLAAMGYAVVLQDVRGRFDSEGEFLPMVSEAADGARTAEWIHDQPWFGGALGTWGLSYLGGTAWATATEVPDLVDALAVGMTHSGLALPDPQGIRHVDTTLRWVSSLELMSRMDEPAHARLRGMLAARRSDGALAEAMRQLPVTDLDRLVLGRTSPMWRSWADHPTADLPFWRTADLRSRRHLVPPTTHTSGWWDLFVTEQLDDHAVQQAQRPTGLVVGPWGHLDPRVQIQGFRQARTHFDAHLRGAGEPDERARVWLGGAEQWWALPSWPPPTRCEEWLLSGGRMVCDDAITLHPVRWRYDPADPTPSLGGRSLTFEAGRVDCAPLEARPDVVVHTSPPLPAATTIAGQPVLHTTMAVDTGSGDLWVRITDVDAAGRSTSVTDGITRVAAAADGAEVTVTLHPIAHRFAAGHRIRVLIAGGSFPAFERNLGVPDGHPSTAGPMRPSTTVLERGAVLRLPVLIS